MTINESIAWFLQKIFRQEKMDQETYQQFAALWDMVTKDFQQKKRYSVHGPDHWRRVARNGLLIAEHSGADGTVVCLFALFHDSRRVNEVYDPGHGQRGAEFAKECRDEFFTISDEQFDLLYAACEGHTDQLYHSNPTIATCWDADRLDLGRVGNRPNPKYLNTDFAKMAARERDSAQFLATLWGDRQL